MKPSPITTIATVLLLLLLSIKGALPWKLDPDKEIYTDESGKVHVRRPLSTPPAPPPASLLPFQFDSSFVNSPIAQPTASPINAPIRIEHEIDLGIDTRYTQLSFLNLNPSRNNDMFLDVGFNSDDCKLPALLSDSSKDSEDKTLSSHPRCRHFNPCCPSILTPVVSAPPPIGEPEWFDDDELEWIDDELEWIDGVYGDATSSTHARGLSNTDDASVAAVDSSQPVPTTQTNHKKRKATAVKEEVAVDTNETANEVSINVTASVHLTLHSH